MTADMLDLARRAVACKGWRWMPGMADCYGRRLREGDWLDPAAEFPDLTDPATLGCLLALVREAWGDPTDYVRCGRKWEWVTSRCVERWPPSGDTEAAALVAALEAAP